MKAHEFTLILTAAPTEGKADKFYRICNDGTLAVSAGVGHVRFHRDANSLEESLRSALIDVRAAGFPVERVEMEPNAVELPT